MNDYSPEQYRVEKALGVRNPNGTTKLTRLTGKHLRIVLLHVNGLKGYEIAKEMSMSPARISNILCDPMVQDEIRRRHEELDGEIFSKSIQVVSESLSDEDHALRLRAADMIWRSRGRYAEKAPTTASAEDIVQRMLAMASGGVNASLTISTSAEGRAEGAVGPQGGDRPLSAGQGVDQPLVEGEPLDDL